MPRTRIVERDVEATMRDGTILRADVYRPQSAQRLPVLLQRTPYGKAMTSLGFILTAVDRGYAVAIQDTRGRWSSEGTHYPFVDEMADGLDTVEWVAHQSWADGKVGMFGGSYVGYTQWAAAAAGSPSLAAIAPAVTFCDPRQLAYRGGAFCLGVMVSWGLGWPAHHAIERLKDDPQRREALRSDLIEMLDGMASGKTFRHLPARDMPFIGREGIVPFLADCLAHPVQDSFWEAQLCRHERIKVPALHIGGWYDIFAASTLKDFAGLRSQAAGRAGPAQQKLLMGPWLHGPMESLVGDVDFGVRSSALFCLPDELQLRWFDAWLKGADNGIREEPPIRIFVMGDNRWRDEAEWPLARTRYVPYYLHSGGAANTLNGDGQLTPVGPAAEPVDTFVYDPRNPVPTRGGGLCCWGSALPAGAYDQRQVEKRPDVLVYTSAALPEDLEVTGPIQVHLWAATTARDTDFTAKLVDVSPCGYARNIQDGILRARYRQGGGDARPVEPGMPCEYAIDLGVTSNVFKAGHRIRMEISSSNFPRFDRNPNTGSAIGEDAELVPAVQTVLHGPDHPSRVVLPVIPR